MSSYVIQGDTFTTIAAKFGTTAEALQQANPGVDHTSLPVGYEIKLPA
jgi:LysM repeat protein